jgi:cell division protease FtsH
MNEAALAAARSGKSTIGWEEVDGALDRLLVGMEKRGGTSMLSRKQVEIVSYHEAGHAICGALLPDYDQVQKISILPRTNGAGGLTFFSPQENRMYSKQYLESQLVVALGGRVAEEIIFGEDFVTTGASNDLNHVAEIAKMMMKEYGMSNAIGPISLTSPDEGRPFMGRAPGEQPHITHYTPPSRHQVSELILSAIPSRHVGQSRQCISPMTQLLSSQ